MTIAILITCHNRCQKTISCLRSLKQALEVYNENHEGKINIEIFLTDDGCTDGTSERARGVFSDSCVLHILKGDGNLYWAGGMRFCWREALKQDRQWEYFLLLNDDVELVDIVFEELFAAQHYAIKHYGKEGLCSGITCAKDDHNKLTYGGSVWVNRFLATQKRLVPNGKPQLCDLTNANILLVPQKVVDDIGIFSDNYKHSAADYDYSYKARKAGYPVILTANFCGTCNNDHIDSKAVAKEIMNMSLKQRKSYFSHPLHSNEDYLHYISQTAPLRYPIVWFGRQMNLYFPKLYYRISGLR
jgi:GT2 family glycosyltransferase